MDVRLGSDVVRAVWDTGAGITLVDPSVVRRVPTAFAADRRGTGMDAGGAQIDTAQWMLSDLVIADHVFEPHLAAELDLARVSASAGCEVGMVLGYPTLRQVDWAMDFNRRRWSLRAESRARPQKM